MPPIDSAILKSFLYSIDSIAKVGNSSFVSSLFILLGGTYELYTVRGLTVFSSSWIGYYWPGFLGFLVENILLIYGALYMVADTGGGLFFGTFF